jgi:glycosyltransferase involved in cell wall biosynthesis
MRILILHNSYQQAGGEDAVAARESALLREHGHEVFLHCVSNDTIRGVWSKVVTAWRTPYSEWGRKEAMRTIDKIDPDIVHVHNFFPLLSPSVYDACRDAGKPVVQRLPNYRIICPGALLMREGKLCETCIQGTPYQAVLHGCYRGSRLGSFAVARMVDIHRRRGTWTKKVDRFIALTEFGKKKFMEAGIPLNKIAVKPNFVEPPELETSNHIDRVGALFVGRLSHEKGVDTLLRAWESLEFPLRIIGDGPMMPRVQAKMGELTAVLGRQRPKQIYEEMARAEFLVMPAESYEGFGLVIIEAFACRLPVITSRLGAMAEIVEDGVTGLHFTPGDAEDLTEKVRWASEHPEDMRQMGRNARRVYEETYSPEINYRKLISIYEEVIGENERVYERK